MWWLLLYLPVCWCESIPDTFNLFVPDGLLAVWMGSSVTLPCSLSPAFTESLEVRWHRPDKHKTPVLLYRKWQIQEQPADLQYQGRVSLTGELEKGNVSLKLENATLVDSGEFICFVSSSKGYQKASVWLTVKAMGTPPVLSVTDGGSGQVNVTCASDGWSPQPTLTWRNREGTEIRNKSYHSATDSQGFVNVTSWLLYPSSDFEWLSCSVDLSEQERKESRILPYISGTSTGPWKNIFICFMVLLLLAVIVVVVLYKKGFIKCRDSKEADSLQDKVDASEGETEDLMKKQDGTELKTRKLENADQQKALDECHIKVSALQSQIEELQDTLNESKRGKETLEKQNEDLQKELNECQLKVGAWENQLEDWDRIKGFRECPTMDEASVHGLLKITKKGKRLNCLPPNNTQTPDTLDYVLCKETFSSGQHYWEVRISGAMAEKQSWLVGVCSDAFRGRSGVPLTPQNGCWVLRYDKDVGFFVETQRQTPVQVATLLNILGVFLDCRGHTLSFYDALSQAHLYTFFGMNPSNPVVPVLSPGAKGRGAIKIL